VEFFLIADSAINRELSAISTNCFTQFSELMAITENSHQLHQWQKIRFRQIKTKTRLYQLLVFSTGVNLQRMPSFELRVREKIFTKSAVF